MWFRRLAAQTDLVSVVARLISVLVGDSAAGVWSSSGAIATLCKQPDANIRKAICRMEILSCRQFGEPNDVGQRTIQPRPTVTEIEYKFHIYKILTYYSTFGLPCATELGHIQARRPAEWTTVSSSFGSRIF